MPQIIVTADRTEDRDGGAVMLRERVNVADFESDHFAAQLVERLGWAVSDASDAEASADVETANVDTADVDTADVETADVDAPAGTPEVSVPQRVW